MLSLLRFSVRVLAITLVTLGVLIGSTTYFYKIFFFVHEQDVARLIEPYFGLAKAQRFENECDGFAAQFVLPDQPPLGVIDFGKTREKMTGADHRRKNATNYYTIKPLKADYIAFDRTSLSTVSQNLRGLDNIESGLADYIVTGIGCWQNYDKKNNAGMTATFRDFIKRDDLTIVLIGGDGHRFSLALAGGNDVFVFGSSI